MRNFSFYEAATGLFIGRTYKTDEGSEPRLASAIAAHTPAGCKAIDGLFDHLSQRVDLTAVARIDEQREKIKESMQALAKDHPHAAFDGCRCETPEACEASRKRHKDLRARLASLQGGAAIVVDYQPPAPSADHEWDADIKRWQLSAAVQERQGRRQSALQSIAALEARQLRSMRELLRDPTDIAARARLDSIEEQIAALREQL